MQDCMIWEATLPKKTVEGIFEVFVRFHYVLRDCMRPRRQLKNFFVFCLTGPVQFSSVQFSYTFDRLPLGCLLFM